jgi:hypothetical protein
MFSLLAAYFNCLYPRPVDSRKTIDGLAAPAELETKVAVFAAALFIFLNQSCLCLPLAHLRRRNQRAA